MTAGPKATLSRIGTDVSQKVTGYMFGNLLTSLIAGIVVFVTLLILGMPFPLSDQPGVAHTHHTR